MEKIAKFYKVSLTQFENSGENAVGYELVKLPTRATAGSAGYDFFAYKDFRIEPKQTLKISTGIKAQIKNGYVLQIYPRSSLGFKYQLALANTVGIVDSDYFNNPQNEGHIFIKLANLGDKTVSVKQGEAFAQGVFVSFGICEDDDCVEVRKGGIGSTSK